MGILRRLRTIQLLEVTLIVSGSAFAILIAAVLPLWASR